MSSSRCGLIFRISSASPVAKLAANAAGVDRAVETVDNTAQRPDRRAQVCHRLESLEHLQRPPRKLSRRENLRRDRGDQDVAGQHRAVLQRADRPLSVYQDEIV